MIHLIQNYYADPNNMGFTLVIDKGRKDKDGKALYDTVGYCGSFEEVIYLLKRRVVNDRLKTEPMELREALQVIKDTTREITGAMEGVMENEKEITGANN